MVENLSLRTAVLGGKVEIQRIGRSLRVERVKLGTRKFKSPQPTVVRSE
jgi:hypothetical protein